MFEGAVGATTCSLRFVPTADGYSKSRASKTKAKPLPKLPDPEEPSQRRKALPLPRQSFPVREKPIPC